MSEGLLSAAVPTQHRRALDDDEIPDAVALLAAGDHDLDLLAGALHDDALQALVVARYAADAAVRGGDPLMARDAVQEALVALRRAVWLLRPRGSDGLPAALVELADRLPLQLDVDVDVEVAAELAPAARRVAYRFVQAATSTGAHGTAAAVALARDGASAVLTVDGELTDAPGWSARARAVGGRLDAPGGPARLRLPLTDLRPEGAR
jgi:signal transduction histidine kinase